MHDMDNIKISSELVNDTIAKADSALRKKRVRIISGASIVAVICTCAVLAFSIGSKPHPDVVIGNNPQATANPLDSLSETEALESLNYARTRHIKVFPLIKTEGTSEVTMDFNESPIYEVIFIEPPTDEELAKYGFLVEFMDEIPEGYMYHLIVFNAPYYPLRYVDVESQIVGDELIFQYTSLDLGPFTTKNYGSPTPTLAVETKMGFFVAVPSDLSDYTFTTEYMKWEDLPETIKVVTVLDTIVKHEDLKTVLEEGVASSLAFELAVLRDYSATAIDYLKKYPFPELSSSAYYYDAYVARHLLYNLLNHHQLENYDLTDPVQAVEKELLSYALTDKENASDNLIIPETYIYNVSQNDDSAEVVLYLALYTFTPPYRPTYTYQAIRAYLDKSGDGTWKVNLIYIAETPDEVMMHMEEYSQEILNIDNTFIKSELLINATEKYNELSGNYLSADIQIEDLKIDFGQIERYLRDRYGEINSTYPAISRDMSTYVLDKNINGDALQIASVYPLSEDFDNPITVAVLAVTYDGSTTESQYPKLYVVTAEYDKSRWALIDIIVEEKETLSLDEFSKLQYRGFYEVYETLFSELSSKVKDINSDFATSLPMPLRKEEDLSGGYLDLSIESGAARFVNVERMIRVEDGSGYQGLTWYVKENPQWLADSNFSQAILSADWFEVDMAEFENSYTSAELGFLGFNVHLYLENEEGFHKFHYTFDTINNTTVLLAEIDGQRGKYYKSSDTTLSDAIIEVFNIETDVSEYMIDGKKGPTLPDYREELRYLTPIVGDMPGGIFSIETSVSSEIKEKGYKESIVDSENPVVSWAQTIGEILESCEIIDMGVGTLIDTIAPTITWDVVLAPQEGVGTLKILGFEDTGSVHFIKTYRLYGSSETYEQYYVIESPELYDKLCEFSFGKTIPK